MSNSVTFDESLRELVSDRAHDIYKMCAQWLVEEARRLSSVRDKSTGGG